MTESTIYNKTSKVESTAVAFDPSRVGIMPVFDRVLVRISSAKKGNIVIPQTIDPSKLVDNNEVEVVAVGPGRMNEMGTMLKPPVEVGDIIIAHRTSLGHPTRGQDGELYYLINAIEIMGIITAKSDANKAQQAKLVRL